MTLPSLCLAFIHTAGASSTLPPPNIQALIKQRISHQWQQKYPSQKSLRFDESCASQGSYHYTERSIVLNADDDAWRGPLEMALSGLIEGERLPFERVASLGADEIQNSKARVTDHESDSTPNWVPWTLAVLGVVSVAYVWVERERHVRELNGLVLRF